MTVAAKNLVDLAKKVLYENLKIGFSKQWGESYKYVSPDKDHYSHQWFWDSCFHAIVLSHFDIELAKNEILSLLKGQREDGFIPHIIFWKGGFSSWREFWRPLESGALKGKTSQLIQPPLIAEAVEAIYEKDKDTAFLREVLPKIVAHYEWLARERDPDEDRLISIIAPYESGMDQSPSYDPMLGLNNSSAILTALAGRTVTFRNMVHRYNLKKIFSEDYFNVEDVLVNAIYIKNLFCLSRLLQIIDKEEKARSFEQLGLKAQEVFIKKFYDPSDGFFYDRYSMNDKWAKVKTIKGLIPLIIDLPKSIASALVKSHLLNEEEFDLPFAVPTVAKNEPTFSPAPVILAKEPIIWRGPTWINLNWYLFKGLKKQGFKEEAEELKRRTVKLIEISGFREFFNPFTGEGYGAHNFSWSTLVVDMLLDKN